MLNLALTYLNYHAHYNALTNYSKTSNLFVTNQKKNLHGIAHGFPVRLGD